MLFKWQLPRVALAWLLIAQLMVIVPHISRLPLWLSIAYSCCVLWRLAILRGYIAFPSIAIKSFLVISVFTGIYFSYRSLIGLEPAISLLIAGFCFKLIECRSKRDCIILVFIGYFAITSVFLFSQSLLVSGYVLLNFVFLSIALLALNDSTDYRFSILHIKTVAKLFMQAIPLMIVLFLIFPRLQPFWQVALPSHQAKTGITDRLSPGDISSLTKDSSLMFRANFKGQIPDRASLYWRGIVMSYFNGRSWSHGPAERFNLERSNDYRAVGAHDQLNSDTYSTSQSADLWHYSIIQEASFRPWLFALNRAESISEGVYETPDNRLQFHDDISERIIYSVVSDAGAINSDDLSIAERSLTTQLPLAGNPRTRAFARELLVNSNSHTDFIQSVLLHYTTAPFFYTLTPPLLGQHSIDEFMFETRKGFCGHYASSFTFIMRSAGIPARVIGGYQGGEINPLTGSVLVHQFDAHAWAEVWLQGRGWLRIDPTAQVSPERIENSIQDIAATSSDFLSRSPLSTARFKNIAWFNRLRMQFDALEYRWANFVLQYKGEKQISLLNDLLGEITAARIIMLLSLAALPIIGWIMYGLLLSRIDAKRKPEEISYQKLCKIMANFGFKRGINEGPINFAKRVEVSKQPIPVMAKHYFLAATRLFVALRYQHQETKSKRLLQKQLFNTVRLLAKQIPLK